MPGLRIREAVMEAVLKDISLGLSISDACTNNSIHRDSIYKRASHDKKFKETLERAILSPKRNAIAIVRKAAMEHWTAAAWWLERKFPDEFAIKTKTELTGRDGGPIETTGKFDAINWDKFTTASLEKMLTKLESRNGHQNGHSS